VRAEAVKGSAIGLMLIAGALAIGLMGMVVIAVGGPKLTAVALGACAIVACGYLLGNVRLLCLYGMLATMSLNLSRKLTGFSDRGGGASAIEIHASDPFWIAIAAFLAWEILTRRRPTIRIPKVLWVWALIMAIGCVTVAFGQWQRVAAYEVIRMAKVATLFIVLVNELQRPKQFIHAAAAIGLGVLLQSGVAAAQYIKNDTIGLEILGETAKETTEQLAESSVIGMEVWRVSGLLLHPNLLGVFLAAAIPLMVAMFLAPIGRVLRLGFLIAAGLGTMALIATFSRSSWVSFFASTVVFAGLILSHKQLFRRSLMPAVAAATVVLMVLCAFAGQIITRLFSSKIDATNARERFKEEAARLIAEKPVFGWGINSYVDEILAFSDFSRAAYGGWVPPVHNIYFLWTADMGLVGLALHLFVVGYFIYVGITNLKIRHPMMYAINAACLAAIAAFLVDGNFSFSLRVNQILRLFWVLGALMVGIRYWRLSGRAAHAPVHPDASGMLPEARGLFRRARLPERSRSP